MAQENKERRPSYSLTPIPDETVASIMDKTPKSRFFEVRIDGSFANPTFVVWRLVTDPGDNNLMEIPDQNMLTQMDIQELKKTAAAFSGSFFGYNKWISVYVTFPELQEYKPVPRPIHHNKEK